MAISVVHFFEMIDVHHQHTKGLRFGFSARRLAPQFRKEGFAGEQSRQFVMDQQAVNLLLELAVDLVKHFEANQLITDDKLVAVF